MSYSQGSNIEINVCNTKKKLLTSLPKSGEEVHLPLD